MVELKNGFPSGQHQKGSLPKGAAETYSRARLTCMSCSCTGSQDHSSGALSGHGSRQPGRAACSTTASCMVSHVTYCFHASLKRK